MILALLYIHLGLEAMHGRLHDGMEGTTHVRPLAISAVRSPAEIASSRKQAARQTRWEPFPYDCALCDLDATFALNPAAPLIFLLALLALIISRYLLAPARHPRRALLLASNRGPPFLA